MGLFDKLKDRLAERVAKESAAAVKTVARKGTDAAVAAARAASIRVEEALFGTRYGGGPPPAEPDRKQRETEMGDRLRAADRRIKERASREAEVEGASAEERIRAGKAISAELAALEEKIAKR